MALRALSQLCGRGARPLVPSVPGGSRRFARRDAGAPTGQGFAERGANGRANGNRETFEAEPDMEDIEDKIQAVLREDKKWRRAVKYHTVRRQMTPPGAPERRLSWDAMEQIRYLRREQPEEWTVERLAKGFSVTTDVISRVLRSKFTQTPERKAKQDAKIPAGLSPQRLPPGGGAGQGGPQLPGQNVASAMLPAGSPPGALVSLAGRTPVSRARESSGGPAASGAVPAALNPRLPVPAAAASGGHASLASTPEEAGVGEDDAFESESEDGESWDGRVFSEKELEEFMRTAEPSPVVQVRKDFFDAEGNFLYRI